MSTVRTRSGKKNERGASLVEYALLIACIALVCISAVMFIGTASKKPFSSVGNSINGAT